MPPHIKHNNGVHMSSKVVFRCKDKLQNDSNSKQQKGTKVFKGQVKGSLYNYSELLRVCIFNTISCYWTTLQLFFVSKHLTIISFHAKQEVLL